MDKTSNMGNPTNLNKQQATNEELLREILMRLTGAQLNGMLEEFGFESPLGTSLRSWLTEIEKKKCPPACAKCFQDELRTDLAANQNGRHEFFAELIRLIDRAQKTDAQVYNAIGMNRSLWYRLRDRKDARTNKLNILKIGIVLKLDYWELYYLVNLAGYSFLSTNDPTDFVIAFCVRHRIYNPVQIDQLLQEAGEKTLFSEG